jgi:hypothetical protein
MILIPELMMLAKRKVVMPPKTLQGWMRVGSTGR